MQDQGYQEIIAFLLTWILFAVAVEALTELIKKAGPLESVRSFLSTKSNFIAELLSCGWCLSVWVAFAVAWIIPSPLTLLVKYGLGTKVIVFLDNYLWWFINGLILHRIANYVHMWVIREDIIVSELEGNDE